MTYTPELAPVASSLMWSALVALLPLTTVFITLQKNAALQVGVDPTLLMAADTSGGVVGKMISPQNLTISPTAVGLIVRESEILRKVLW